MSTDVSGIITQAAGYVHRATTYVVDRAKIAYVALRTAVAPAEAPIKGAELERTGDVKTPQQNATESLGKTTSVLHSMQDSADTDAYITDFYSKFVTPETEERYASTSFNVAMALGAFDDVYEKMALAS